MRYQRNEGNQKQKIQIRSQKANENAEVVVFVELSLDAPIRPTN